MSDPKQPNPPSEQGGGPNPNPGKSNETQQQGGKNNESDKGTQTSTGGKS